MAEEPLRRRKDQERRFPGEHVHLDEMSTPPPPPPEASEPQPVPTPPDTAAAPGPPPAPPAPAPDATIQLDPTGSREREPIIDLLRGFALLGILLINVELMRGPGLYHALAGQAPPAGTTADAITGFLSAWLAGGKFISSFALLFGVGAAFIIGRAERRGASPRRLLARRYTLLLLLGLAHMFLLFPGDILFAYALAGFILIAFATVTPKVAAWTGAGIYAGLGVLTGLFAALTMAFSGMGAGDAEVGVDLQQQMFGDRIDQAVQAYAEGGIADMLGAHAFEAAILQLGHVLFVPWILALFLVGFAITRNGVVADLAGHRGTLRRTAVIGLGVGLPLNLPLGFLGPLGIEAAEAVGPLEASATFLQFVAPPVLAVGYLSAIALLVMRIGVWRPLAAVGRMALTAYLLQSVFSVIVFKVIGLYGDVSASEALVFVVGTWLLLLVLCPLWLRWFAFGPVEWLWRSGTYRSWQPLRLDANA